MSYGTNLSACLGILKLTNKNAADIIGISYNTLSNILNNKVEPSDESRKKILTFLESHGFSEEDLLKDSKIIQNIRIRSSSILSGIEKAQFREDFINFMKILEKSDSEKMKWVEDCFDYCDRPTDITDQETLWDRRNELLRQVKQKNEKGRVFEVVYNCYANFSSGRIMLDSYSPINILFFLDSLGIRRFFVPFKTEKIASFSTSLESEYTTPFSYREEDPVIVINTKVCNTTEKCLFEIAKQFYYMISLSDEFSFLNSNKIQIENADKEKLANTFAQNVMIHPKFLNDFLQERKSWFPSISPIDKKLKDFFFKNYDFSYVVNTVKSFFHVGYELAIEQLFKTDFDYLIFFNGVDDAKSFYFECLKRHDEEYQDKITYLNGEPEPLPSAYRGINFAKMIYTE